MKNDYESNPNFRAMKAHRAALMRNDGRAGYWFPQIGRPLEQHTRTVRDMPTSPMEYQKRWPREMCADGRRAYTEHMKRYQMPDAPVSPYQLANMPDGPEKTAAYVTWFCLANNLTL